MFQINEESEYMKSSPVKHKHVSTANNPNSVNHSSVYGNNNIHGMNNTASGFGGNVTYKTKVVTTKRSIIRNNPVQTEEDNHAMCDEDLAQSGNMVHLPSLNYKNSMVDNYIMSNVGTTYISKPKYSRAPFQYKS